MRAVVILSKFEKRHPNRMHMEAIRKMIRENYGLEVEALHPLEGYEDKTYLMKSPAGAWILKEHLPRPGLRERISLEARLMAHFGTTGDYVFPELLPTLSGEEAPEAEGRVYRVMSYLEGTFLGKLPARDWPLAGLGRLLGVLARKSLDFSGLLQEPEASPWDLQHLPLHKANLRKYIQEPPLASAIAYFIQQFESEVEPWRYGLRKGFIHNDANEWNILLRNGEISGLIDFGDSCYSWIVNDLAVGLTYALMDRPDPLDAAQKVISAYSGENRLLPLEADILYYLVAGRLCMSLCNSARARELKPDSAYVSISEEPARRLLMAWLRLNPRAASMAFRKAAGLPEEALPDAARYEQRRRQLFSPALSLSYQRPIIMERSAFQYMYSPDGTTFLDAYNNIMLVGHSHPHVVERGCAAMRRLNTNTRYHYEALPAYAEKLLERFPPGLSRVFFVNSGSAATDLALRLARWYTGHKKVAALQYGYHGNTEAALAVSHYKHREGAEYPETLVCPLPKVFGSGLPDDGQAGRHFSEQLKATLENTGAPLAAFIAEPIVGCGGQVPLPQGYLKQVYPVIRSLGGLCISDEVQVGFGRLGQHFWGFEMQEEIPDIVVLGKPMANGHPMGAVVCTAPIAEAFGKGPEFFSSFGGNPVSCAIGLAVLEVLSRDDLPGHAAGVGQYLTDGLRDLQGRFPHLSDVRGSGLFLGVELTDARGRPATTWAQALKNALREQQVLIGTDGPYDNVLKIKPPLPFNRNNCNELLTKIEGILKGMPFI